jgi:hypothetical protein
VERGGVRRGATDDHRDVELVDETLEVERLGACRDVLRRDRRASDDEEVRPRVHDRPPELLGSLRRQRSGHRDTGGADLAQPRRDQLGHDGLGVQLLHSRCGVLVRQARDLREERLGVLIPGPQPLEVEHSDATEPTEGNRSRRAHH